MASKDWPFFIETTARTGFPQFAPADVKAVLWDAMTQSDHVAQASAIRAASGERLLRRVRVPTLLLATRMGTRPTSAEDANKRWAAMLPNSQLVLLEDDQGGGLSPTGRSAPEVAVRIEDFLRELDAPRTRAQHSGDPGSVTPREIEVLRLLAAGKSNPQIAETLVISRNTVAKHVSSIFAKTGVANRVEAAVYARDHGIS